jgi:acetylornithine deacetylase/succinyl-diaminopimelate desuccinylase-like protein
MEAVASYIDEHEDRFIRELQTYIRQPSAPAEDGGSAEEVRRTAEMTANLMRQVGIDARLLETATYPVVFGELRSRVPNARTLLVYSHYGVVNPGNPAEWVVGPYSAEIMAGSIIGRGASDPKGNVIAAFKAVEAWRVTQGDLPINLKFVFPCGERARKDPAFVDNYRHLLGADSLVMIDAGFTRDGNCPVHLGSVAALQVRFQVRTGSKDPYIIWTQLIPHASFRLIAALNSVRDADERVLIDGFYDDVKPPTTEELALMETYPWQDEGELSFWGVDHFVGNVKGIEAVKRLLYEPAVAVCVLKAGDENMRSLVPCHAEAWVNFHLVPNQRGDDILDKLKQHLAKHGFDDIMLRVDRLGDPFAGSARSPIGNAVVRASRQAGFNSYLMPHSFELWGEIGQRLGLDQALFGIGDPDRKAHFANEHISLHNYLNGIKWIAALYGEYAAA